MNKQEYLQSGLKELYYPHEIQGNLPDPPDEGRIKWRWKTIFHDGKINRYQLERYDSEKKPCNCSKRN
jgi:hypothetical protein